MWPIEMNCVNLLAFIQIAIAFDISLLIFSDSHIFSKIHDSLVEELKGKSEKEVKKAKALYEQLSEDLKKSTSTRIQIRSKRAQLKARLDEMEIYDSKETNWSKYSYIGLYAAIYGLLSLFVIGLFQSRYDIALKNFLLLSGSITLIYEILYLVWLRKVDRRLLSYYKIYQNLGLYLILTVICIIAAGKLGFYSLWLPFNRIYVPLSVIVIYMPILVFAYRICQRIWKTEKLVSQCSEVMEKIGGTNPL